MLPLIPVWGTDLTYNHFAVPWAFTMDTPYRWVKQVASLAEVLDCLDDAADFVVRVR
jgi:hypothetical protein